MKTIPAPDFRLLDQTGAPRTLGDFAGQWLIVYLYPKDDTPGCTAEACSLRDIYGQLQAAGVQVVGISKDSVKSHARFAEKYSLTFPLLSDPTTTTIQAYGAWQPLKFMGREYLGTARMTFLINPQGHIIKTYPKVTPKDHATELWRDIQALPSL